MINRLNEDDSFLKDIVKTCRVEYNDLEKAKEFIAAKIFKYLSITAIENNLNVANNIASALQQIGEN